MCTITYKERIALQNPLRKFLRIGYLRALAVHRSFLPFLRCHIDKERIKLYVPQCKLLVMGPTGTIFFIFNSPSLLALFLFLTGGSPLFFFSFLPTLEEPRLTAGRRRAAMEQSGGARCEQWDGPSGVG